MVNFTLLNILIVLSIIVLVCRIIGYIFMSVAVYKIVKEDDVIYKLFH